MTGAHRIVRHGAARRLPGYHPLHAPALRLAGSSTDWTSEHGRATAAQWSARGARLLGEQLEADIEALALAGVSRGGRRQAGRAAEAYVYVQLGLQPEHVLPGCAGPAQVMNPAIAPALEQVLGDVVAALVDRDYDEVAAMTLGVHRPQDLRARIEDDYGVDLTLPPLPHYRTATARRVGQDGPVEEWRLVLDLQDEQASNALHIDVTAWTSNADTSLRLDGLKS